MKKIIWILFIFLCISCQKVAIKNRIAALVEARCKGVDTCNLIININEVVEFKWDKLYFFCSGASQEDISKELGFKYVTNSLESPQMIFVSENKVVYSEFENIDPEAKPEVIFHIAKDSIHKYYNLNNAVFKVKKSIVKGLKYYELTPIK